jgi:hypothetical protein
MSYTITDTTRGTTAGWAATRSDAVAVLGYCGVNAYAAVRLLDQADGLRPDDGVPRPVTVKRED